MPESFSALVLSILQSPIFLAVSFLVDVLGIILAFDRARAWVDRNLHIASRSSPALLPILLGLVAASLPLSSLAAPPSIPAMAAGLLAILALTISATQSSFDRRAATRAYDLLRHVFELHSSPHKLSLWRITYDIRSDGGVHTTDTMRIVPLTDAPVHFRHVSLGVHPTAAKKMQVTDLKAYTTHDKRPLEIVPLRSSPSHQEFAVVLDPPATRSTPSEITIESDRPRVFGRFLQDLRQEGRVHVMGSDPSLVEVAFAAPTGITLQSLAIAPACGDISVRQLGAQSSATWRAENVPNGYYKYTLYATRTP